MKERLEHSKFGKINNWNIAKLQKEGLEHRIVEKRKDRNIAKLKKRSTGTCALVIIKGKLYGCIKLSQER